MRQLTGILDHNNCIPNRFAKKKCFSRLCQQPSNTVGYANPKPNKFCSIKTARNASLSVATLLLRKGTRFHDKKH